MITRILPAYLISLFFCSFGKAQKLEKVADIYPGAGSNPYAFTVAANKLFFLAIDGATSVNLYVTDGTSAGTQKLTPPGIIPSSFSSFIEFNGKLFFACNDGVNGKELWTSDGTAAGTVLLKDIFPGATGSNPFGLTVMNNRLYFLASGPTGTARLYASDGTEQGTSLVWDQQCTFFDNLNRFAILNNEIYFKAGVGVNTALWKSDGTTLGTGMVKAGVTPMCPDGKYAVLGDKLFFCGNDLTNSAELYVTDGTAAGTYMVKNIYPDQPNIKYGSTPKSFTVFNGKVYFSAIDDTHGDELFVTDGTEAGTFLVKDLATGTASSRPGQMIIFNNTLYISCLQTKQLWKSDGNEAGTTLVSTLNDAWYFGAIWNNKIYASPGSLSGYLYQTDGTALGTGFARADNTVNLISNYNLDNTLTVYNGNLYFGGSNPDVSIYREPLRLVPTIVPRKFSFVGTGNWSNPANWLSGNQPPATLLAGDTVLISENCVLDITVHAQAGSSITVAAGKNLLVQGGLIIQ